MNQVQVILRYVNYFRLRYSIMVHCSTPVTNKRKKSSQPSNTPHCYIPICRPKNIFKTSNYPTDNRSLFIHLYRTLKTESCLKSNEWASILFTKSEFYRKYLTQLPHIGHDDAFRDHPSSFSVNRWKSSICRDCVLSFPPVAGGLWKYPHFPF